MARTYPDKFNTDSPLSPMSATSTSTPISYSANVNRQKTKKWVEAKAVDYGGDDWGDEDDGYSPPPIIKPTGLRQPGQVAQSPIVASPFNNEGNKKTYGDLPPIPAETQGRSVSSPIRDRANSFSKDDEHRAFSGGHAPPPAAAAAQHANVPSNFGSARDLSTTPRGSTHPVLQVSTQIPPVTGSRKAVQPSAPAEMPKPQGAARTEEPQSGTSSKYSEATSKYSEARTPASDFQARRDFSPSAVPSPLQPRYSPAPVSAATDSPSSRFSPRKSSISRQFSPDVSVISQSASEGTAAKPWAEPRSSSPGATARSPTSPAKSLPFIRPADIYKRIEEEREKERQSLDSSRPSMESIVGPRVRERSMSPGKPTMRGQSSSDSLGGSFRKVTVQENDADTGRRLAPMLEPVRERKSEYGFEGFDPALASKASEGKKEIAVTKDAHDSQTDHEELRRFSVSPKLPDLNRISGFGLDLFSQTRPDDSNIRDSTIPPMPENPVIVAEKDYSLRTQPSFGFTSMVHQAFDTDNKSVPETSASAPTSGVERTNSESTGTTGISPIMSRVPSTTPANTRDRELSNQQTATPSITEVDEPDSAREPPEHSRETPPSQIELSGSENQSIRPDYRRNMSTPSPGSSPARTPNLETTARLMTAEEAHISPSSDPAVSPLDEEDLSAPSRPLVDREQSFRPALPGGWVSYATSASDVTSERPDATQRSETPNLREEASNTPVSPISEESDDEIDLTPTTTKRALHQSALGAVAGAALGGVAAATFGKLGRESPVNPHTSTNSGVATRTLPGNSSLPTPDPALAPIGNPYAASALDPRLQSDIKDKDSRLQVPSTYGSVSVASSAPPTPPPKDTPAQEAFGRDPDYFPPTVPLKSKTLDEVAANEGLTPPMRPPILPTLSTQTSPQDQDSDKLRKEIVKTLSPTASDAEARHRLLPPYPPEPEHIDESTAQATRESTYLPSEYDNYWESTNDSNAELEKAEEAGLEPIRGPESKVEKNQPIATGPRPLHDERYIESAPNVAPLSVNRVDTSVPAAPGDRPPIGTHRFSWEAGPEHVTSKPVAAHSELLAHPSALDNSYAATPDAQLRQLEETRESYFDQGPISTSATTPAIEEKQLVPSQGPSSMYSTSIAREPVGPDDHSSSNSQVGSGVALAASGVAGAVGAAAFAGYQSNQSSMARRRPSLAEEKDPANASSYEVSPTPPEDEHPARSSLPPVSPLGATSSPAPSTQQQGRDPIHAPQPQRTSDTARVMQFRDILQFQNADHRIRAYDDTRKQFAGMDTGLNEWLKFLSSQQSDGTGSWADPTSSNSTNSRPKVQAQHGPLQQPYYQQYLNASPTAAVTPTSRPGTGPISGSQQGLSPGAGKSPGQQSSQGKGKDLLHSAGIFGGKASKAGKGLLHKFRGSGGGDKNSPPLEASPAPKPPKVNEGRRSSWGVSMSSLTLPRPSRADTSSQHSREGTPTRQQPSRLGQDTLSTASTGTAGQQERSVSEAPVSAASTPSIVYATPQPLAKDEPQVSQPAGSSERVSKEEARDALGVPAPIGKYQPSWDPYNATPIVEEEGFQLDQRSSMPPAVIANPSNQLAAPPNPPTDSKSDRSNSGETRFYDAREEVHEPDDWVLVSKDENPPRGSETPRQNGQKINQPIHGSLGPHIPASQPQTPSQGSYPIQTQSQPSPPGPPQGFQPHIGDRTGSPGQFQATGPGIYPTQAPSRQLPGPPQGFQPRIGDNIRPQAPPSQFQAPPHGGYQSQGQFQLQPGAHEFQPPMGQPRVPYQQYQHHPGSQPQQGYQSQTSFRQAPEPQPPIAPQPPSTAQSAPVAPTGFRGRFIQHIRQRSSKDANMIPPDQPPPQQVSSQVLAQAQQQQRQPPSQPQQQPQNFPMQENREPARQSTDFVGLPPIRRSSTFGLGFRSKERKERFPLEDDDEDGVQPNTVGLSTEQAENGVLGRNADPALTLTSQTEAISRPSDQRHDGEIPIGAATIAAAVGDRIYQPSGEASRYSFIEGQEETEAAAQSHERPLITAKSSEYSQLSGFSPVSPPVSPPVLPTTTPNTRPIVVGGPQGNYQQGYGASDRKPEAAWLPNARQSQEQRDSPMTPTQRPPSLESQQGSPMATRPRQPSFDGQRSGPLGPHQRGPSLDGQRIRSGSQSSQGYQGPLLNSGAYVPPPRTGPAPQKQFDQPPSSAQRYPELFKPELAKETSVDGLPANYYQSPISREDAFLPRQQTNEYQLPGVGPPPEEPQSGKRSRRNSALLKELGGRLSRSASRDRGSTRDDDTPIRPTESRDSHGRDLSTASVTSEDTLEKTKRRSGFGFLGALRRESTGGPPRSRDSMLAHAPVSRADSFVQQQQPSSPLAPPDRKKSFFGVTRSSTDDLKTQPNKLSRVSTSSAFAEQQGKKKRFSGLTGMFSRPSTEQEKKEPAVLAAQDSRNYQRPGHFSQGPPPQGSPYQGMPQDPRNFQGQPRAFPQAPPPSGQGPYQQNLLAFQNGGQGNFQPNNALRLQQFQRQESGGVQGGALPQIPPAANPQSYQGQQPPTQGQHPSFVGQQPVQRPVLGAQGPQTLQHSPASNQRASVSQPRSPQASPETAAQPIQSTEAVSNVQQSPSDSNYEQGRPIGGRVNQQQPQPRMDGGSNQQGPPIEGTFNQQPQTLMNGGSQQGLPMGGRVNQQPQTPMNGGSQQGQPMGGRVTQQQPQPPTHATGNQQGQPMGGRVTQQQPQPPMSGAINQQGQPMGGRVTQQQSQPPMHATGNQQGQPMEGRVTQQQPQPPMHATGNQQGQPMGGRVTQQQLQHSMSGAINQQVPIPPLQVSPQSQFQRYPASPSQPGLRPTPSPQPSLGNSQDGRNMLTKQSAVQGGHQQSEQKSRKSSGLFSGLLGGRRSSAQQVSDPRAAANASPQPSQGPRQPQQQMQQPPQGQQQRFTQQGHPQGAPGQNQERGRTLTQEPRYAPLPIPGAYTLVRGEGGQLAPTSYDPRGMNNRTIPPGQFQPTLGNQGQPYSTQQPPEQGQQYQQNPNASLQRPNAPSALLSTPQNSSSDARPGLGPYQHGRRSSRPLSSEDLVARSPARPQFGQQAPYQLSLPGEPDNDDEDDRHLPLSQDLPTERKLSPSESQHTDKGVPIDRNTANERPIPAAAPLNTHFANPALRHPMSPATYPLPEETLFSPVNPSAAQVPPPPPPKWPDQASPSQNLDRSNTINTHASTISQMSGHGQLNIPSPPSIQARTINNHHPDSVTPPSPQITPQITPERSPEQISSRAVIAPQTVMAGSEGNRYSVSPMPSPLPPGAGHGHGNSNASNDLTPGNGAGARAGSITPTKAPPPLSSPDDKILVEEGIQAIGSGSGRRRASQEEKILVEEGMLRPGSANPGGPPVLEEDVVPSMSATSYPGQEWHPYGNGYEEWD